MSLVNCFLSIISGQPDIMGVEMAKGVDKLPSVGFQFTVSQDPLTTQSSPKLVKEHRVHNYVGKDLLLKRQARALEDA